MTLQGADLVGLPLFRDLSPAEIDRFLQATGVQVREYEKHARIMQAFEPNKYIGIMVSGEAFVISEDRFGHETVTHHLERGALFGSISAILPNVDNISSIEAITDVIVILVAYCELITSGTHLGRTHGIVMKNLLEAFSRKNFLMTQKLELLAQKTLRERLILYLMQREKRQQRGRVRTPGRIQMAKEMECNRSALTREIAEMKEQGLLICGDGWMQLDKARLAARDKEH